MIGGDVRAVSELVPSVRDERSRVLQRLEGLGDLLAWPLGYVQNDAESRPELCLDGPDRLVCSRDRLTGHGASAFP